MLKTIDHPDIHTEENFLFETSWGKFYIGQEVKLSEEALENASYKSHEDVKLTITWVDMDYDGLDAHEPIMSFSLPSGEEFPFSLYGYEITPI